MKTLKRFISEDELEIRWNLNSKQLEALIREWRGLGKIIMWYAEEVRQLQDGTRVAFVKPAQYFSGSIFDMNEILMLEAGRPELLAPKVEVRGRPATPDTNTPQPPEYEEMLLPPDEELCAERKRIRTTQALIPLKELLQRWTGATKQEIITEERAGRLVPYYKEKTIINPETLVKEHWLWSGRLPTFMDFGQEWIDEAQDCVFLKRNVLEIEAERPDFLYMRDDSENGGDECIDSPPRTSAENQRPEPGITEKQKAIREPEQQSTTQATAHPKKRTDAANDARQEKALATWKEAFPCMVRVYARMEPGRQYVKKEVVELFEAEGVEVRVNREGKPRGALFGYFWQVFMDKGRPIDDLSSCRWSLDVSAATTTDHVLTRTDNVNVN